jgi:hypothetical protein
MVEGVKRKEIIATLGRREQRSEEAVAVVAPHQTRDRAVHWRRGQRRLFLSNCFIALPAIDLRFIMPSVLTRGRAHNGEGREMKNPLDSLGQTVILGVVLTIVMALLIRAIAV